MVDIHFHPVRRPSFLHRRHHHHGHHHFRHHRTHPDIECGDSIICKVFFGLIILAMIIGFIVAAVKGAFIQNNEHSTNSNNKSHNKK